MFLPRSKEEEVQSASEAVAKKKAISKVETWAREAIPEKLREGVQIMVQEVQCGDPECAPIDTAIAIMYPSIHTVSVQFLSHMYTFLFPTPLLSSSGQRGMMGIPMEVQEVTRDDLVGVFPTEDVLRKWKNGEEAEWPPMDDDDGFDGEQDLPTLRFEVGQRVECRVGPHPVNGWAGGKVVQLWYREPGWPPRSWAPYKILLDDGRNIYAPGDIDQIIRKKES